MIRIGSLALLLVVGIGCAARLTGEKLGGGFTRVAREVPAASADGSAKHVDHLYFQGSDLGEVGFVSVAPSGHHALFERKGALYLIASADGHLEPVTDGAFSIPKAVRWHEPERFAEIEYVDAHPMGRIPLR